MTFKDLEKKVNSLVGFKNSVNFATNSTSVCYFKTSDKKADYFFWIDPPWRIIKQGRGIQNSADYPFHQNYKDSESKKESSDFKKWCAQSEKIRNRPILSVAISEIGDLKISWSGGYFMDVFLFSSKESSYHFYDYVSWIDYEAFQGKIITSKIKKRKR